MCGIAGIVGHGPLTEELAAMVAVQAHRGPDDYGLWTDEAAGIALGHNRLSIIDLSRAGRQPMTDGNGLWLVYNGEIYNYRELRAELSDYPFKSQTDSEVILAAWRRWGRQCLTRFIGMFAFALWDEHKRELFCARDRLGIKPFHYAWHRGRLLFASEAKAILAGGLPAQPDMKAWAVYLVHGLYDHSEDTFFSNIRVLPAGHYGVLEHDRWVVQRYWDPMGAAVRSTNVSDDEAAARLMELFEDSIKLRLRADVPVGINLSGGLDSSMLVVAVDRLLGNGEGRIETFTASFGDPRYDEDSFADRIPRHNHWQRHVVRIDADECWDALVRGLWYQEAPFGGVATVAYHKLHAEARKRGVIVLLEAQGADEIFAGYPYFRPAYWRDLLDAGRYQALRSEWRALPREERRKWIDHLRKLLRTGTLAVHYDGTSHLRETGLARDLVQMANGAPDFEAPFSSHLENALWRDTRHTKLPRVLRMNDRLSMASSTELREPFLDHRIVEFAFKLPASQKIRLGQGKYVQRHALRAQLPASVRTEPKRMVVTPQREWFRGSLRRRAEDILSSRSFAERGLFEPKSAQAVFRAFADGQGDNAFFIWQWVNVELWFRTFIDADTRAGSRTLAEVYDDPWKRTTIGETA